MVSAEAEQDRSVAIAESRGSPRRRSYFHGKIVSRDGAYSLDCVVRNLSETGARLQLGGRELLPLRFFLLCTVLKKTFDTEIVWRRSDWIGVKFYDAYDMTVALPGELRVVQKLFAEHSARPSSGLYGQ